MLCARFLSVRVVTMVFGFLVFVRFLSGRFLCVFIFKVILGFSVSEFVVVVFVSLA